MKKILSLFAVLCMAVSMAWAAEGDQVAKLDLTTQSVSASAYANEYTVDNWKVMGANNSKGWAYFRIGGKAATSGQISNLDRTITGTAALTAPVKQIQIRHNGFGGKNATAVAALNLVSIDVEVSSTSNFASTSKTTFSSFSTFDNSGVNEGAGTEILTPSTAWTENLYYKITIHFTMTNTNNCGLDVYDVTFIEAGNGDDDDTPSISAEDALELTAEEGDGTFEVTWTGMEDVDVNLYTDEACTSAFDGSWFQVDLDGENNVEYLVAENTSTSPRTVYMQLYGIDEESNDYTHVVTVTQAGVIVKYDVLVDDEIENGEISASVATAEAGEEVTLTATPDDGYKLGSWVVTDSEDQPVSVTNNKFIMPESGVLVTATFVEKPLEYTWDFSDASSQPTSETADLSFAAGNFTFTFGSGAYNNAHFKWYAGKDFTITAPVGYGISNIVFTYVGNDYDGRGKITVSTGTYTKGSNRGEWNGQASELTLSNSDTRQCRIGSITIAYFQLQSGSFTLTEIDGAGWGTYYTDYAFVMPENVEGRLMKNVEGTIKAVTTYNAGDVVPANTGLLLKGTAGNHNLYETWNAATTSATGNLLKGSVEGGTTTGGNVYYKLANDSEDGLGWYWGAANGAEFTCGAHKAYLALDVAPSLAPAIIRIVDEAENITGIENIEAKQAVKFFENGQIYILKNGNVYNVAGQIVR